MIYLYVDPDLSDLSSPVRRVRNRFMHTLFLLPLCVPRSNFFPRFVFVFFSYSLYFFLFLFLLDFLQVRQINAVEGVGGFFRGALPRLLVHMPSVAISWTTYETVKVWLSEGSSRGSH